MWWKGIPVLAAALALSACASVPSGPSVMVLPGAGKPLDQFQLDDAACRQWATQQMGPRSDSSWMMQRRYDIAYQQCMYSRGHDLPGVSRSSGPPTGPGQRVPTPPPGAGTPPPGTLPPRR
jgi:hypothetical protein